MRSVGKFAKVSEREPRSRLKPSFRDAAGEYGNDS